MEPILIIDPGHGGKDPGGGSNDQFVEKNKVLEISLYQHKRFQQLGVPVAMTRTEDIYLSPTERTDIVKQSGAEYCISNHINAATPAARGVETIHSIFSDGRLATKIYESIVSAGMPSRRVFKKEGANGKDYYFMHRLTGSVETIIVEYGFATNAEDTKLIIKNWTLLAEAVVKAFCDFINHPYKEPEAPQEPVDSEIKMLEERVNQLEALHHMDVPGWAEEAVNAAVSAGIVDTPNGRSFDFYSLLTVLHRKGII